MNDSSHQPEDSNPDHTEDVKEGDTRMVQDGKVAPRLPHEHDQSTDSQQYTSDEPPKVGQQAHKDLKRGLVDTDRAPVTDALYEDVKKPK